MLIIFLTVSVQITQSLLFTTKVFFLFSTFTFFLILNEDMCTTAAPYVKVLCRLQLSLICSQYIPKELVHPNTTVLYANL